MPKRNWSESPFENKDAYLRYFRRKAARKNEKRREINLRRKTTLRTVLKKTEAAIGTGNIQQAQEMYREAASQLDKAAQKGIIKKNNADRKKSRLALMINKMATV